MNLNSLPELCLRRILSFLPLRDLLRSHQVCRLWASIQRSTGTDRQQVTICIGDDAISRIYNSPFRMPYEVVLDPNAPADREPRHEYDAQNAKDNFDLLQFAWLNSVTCDKLVSLLPNVIELKVAVCKVPPAIAIDEISWGLKSVLMNQIIKMLTRWRSTLEAFTVSISFIGNQQQQIDQDIWRLFHAINQLDSLRRLTIAINENLNVNIAPSITDIEPFQFSVFSHLEQFSFLDYGQNLALLVPSLIKHGGAESTLQRISLANIGTDDLLRDDYLFVDFTRQTGHWMRNVVHFPDLTISKFDRNVLSICDKFSQLESITISVDPLAKISQMLKYLESLRHLIYLEMNIFHCDDENGDPEDPVNLDMNRDEPDEIDRPPVPIVDPCLPSVRVLMIYAPIRTHNDLHHFSWPSILPNLEILHYDHSFGDCQICVDVEVDNMIDDQEPIIGDRSPLTRYESMIRRDCTKKLLSPWTRCPQIRRIYSGTRAQSKRWDLSEIRQYLGDE